MERLLSILRRFNKRDANISVKSDEYTYLGDIYLMLSWKCPFYTLINFIILNYFLWLAAYSHFRALGLISTIVLLKFLYQSTLAPQMNVKLLSSSCEEIHNYVRAFISSFSLYRNENPSEFCVVFSFFFFILTYITSYFSGVMLCFLILWGLFLTPLIYSKMPPHMKEKLEVLSSLGRFQAAIAEEDLFPIPVETRDDQEDLESLDTDRTADSVTNSLISGISSMPSFLDAEDNHEIMEEDLMPINLPTNSRFSPANTELSSDSESELRDIQFKESHFTRESSSEEEGAFEEGLFFDESQNATQNENKGLVYNIAEYVSSKNFKLPNIFNNTTTSIQSTETKKNIRKSSSSDEDFEIIDANELK